MEKILITLNATQINLNVSAFANYIEKLTHSKLTGIFLENLQAEEVPVIKSLHGIQYVETIVAADIPGNKIRVKLSKENVHTCKKPCKNSGVNCSMHRHHGSPVAEVIAESRFADLLIVDAEMSFKEKHEGTLTGFIIDVIAKAECPIVIAPSSFHGIDEVLFTYDGSASSVFAIKHFIYLFPGLADKKITILQVNEKEDLAVFEKEKISELLQMHYSNIDYQFLHGKASDELFGYLLDKKNIFVVMGAFGRNMLSGFFRLSTAELIIKTFNRPIFIAHH
jgi:hypothetical protein